MTGGQMAPTTLVGQKTKTTPFGRDQESFGTPIRMCEILDALDAPVYIERVSVHDVKNVLKTKKAIKKGLQYQIDGAGYSFIEVLSMCPTNWGVSPLQAAVWVKESMVPYYQLGVFRDRVVEEKQND